MLCIQSVVEWSQGGLAEQSPFLEGLLKPGLTVHFCGGGLGLDFEDEGRVMMADWLDNLSTS